MKVLQFPVLEILYTSHRTRLSFVDKPLVSFFFELSANSMGGDS